MIADDTPNGGGGGGFHSPRGVVDPVVRLACERVGRVPGGSGEVLEGS